jgi:hypothetical protein
VHVRYRDAPSERWDLVWRDYLRSHPAELQAYADAKRAAARLSAIGDAAASGRPRDRWHVVRITLAALKDGRTCWIVRYGVVDPCSFPSKTPPFIWITVCLAYDEPDGCPRTGAGSGDLGLGA